MDTICGEAGMYAPGSRYFSPKSLRSRPRRHLGERTTTIPIFQPPLLLATRRLRLLHPMREQVRVTQKDCRGQHFQLNLPPIRAIL